MLPFLWSLGRGWQVALPLIFNDIYILYIWCNSFSVFILILLNLQNILSITFMYKFWNL